MGYKILGVSASLRNARRGLGNKNLLDDILSISNENELKDYLKQQAFFHLQNFKDAGRNENLPFDKMYTNLKKQKGNKGLSNSEVALVSSLWSAKELGAEIDHISLSEYYTESKVRNEDELILKLSQANGIIVSSPVYFGDRSSLAQALIDLLRDNEWLKKKLKNKIYAGIAVGAKRNGGQETTLIYQLMDMLNIGLLGVGNDSETTSQYGGTGLAGDIGTMPNDDYGLATAMGTGRRVARVTQLSELGKNSKYNGKHKVQFWILQDQDDKALNLLNNLISQYSDQLDFVIINASNKRVMRCLACDVCPTHISIDEEYRCIIKSKKDDFEEMHPYFLDSDAVIPVVFSPKNRLGLNTNYQKFMERTRYLRRGDYLMSDIVSSPIVFEEIGANENMHIRMITSMIRHHTILSKPIIGYINKNKIINSKELNLNFKELNSTIRKIAKGRLLMYSDEMDHLKYKPVGYILSAAKDEEDEKLNRRAEMMENRKERVTNIKEIKISSK
jgi:multimeric flavodoxin WrbA